MAYKMMRLKMMEWKLLKSFGYRYFRGKSLGVALAFAVRLAKDHLSPSRKVAGSSGSFHAQNSDERRSVTPASRRRRGRGRR